MTRIWTPFAMMLITMCIAQKATGQTALVSPDPLESIPACFDEIARFEESRPEFSNANEEEVKAYYFKSKETDEFCENKLVMFSLGFQAGEVSLTQQERNTFVSDVSDGAEAAGRNEDWRGQARLKYPSLGGQVGCELPVTGDKSDYYACIQGVIAEDNAQKQLERESRAEIDSGSRISFQGKWYTPEEVVKLSEQCDQKFISAEWHNGLGRNIYRAAGPGNCGALLQACRGGMKTLPKDKCNVAEEFMRELDEKRNRY